MKMMYKLLDNVTKSWDRIPKNVPVIAVHRGNGLHFMMTVDNNQLYFHSQPYNKNLPVKQSILLEDLSLNELVDTINSMGYVSLLTSEAHEKELGERKAHTLTNDKNRTIIQPNTLTTFTSKLWEMLYPIARLLHETDNDMDKAIAQMFATSTKGKWLDYWGTFFRIKRNHGESDAVLSRRIFMSLVNLKTNNIAIEELVQFAIQSDAKVRDVAPALFEIVVAPDYIDKSGILHPIIRGVKGAGIDYFLNYMEQNAEDYRTYLSDLIGGSFRSMDKGAYQATWGKLKEVYSGAVEGSYGFQGFGSEKYLSKSDMLKLLSSEVLQSEVVKRAKDSASARTIALEERSFKILESSTLTSFQLNSSELNGNDILGGYSWRISDIIGVFSAGLQDEYKKATSEVVSMKLIRDGEVVREA